MRNLFIITSLIALCGGCDLAARQQAAEEARREQAQKELKAIGEALHKKQNDAPLPVPPAADGAKSSSESPAESGEAAK